MLVVRHSAARCQFFHRRDQPDAISNRLAAKRKREGAVDGIGHEGAQMGAYQFGVDGTRSHQNRKDPASSAWHPGTRQSQ